MKTKAQKLANEYGHDDIMDVCEEYIHDCGCPGICMNDGCDATYEYEHDQDKGWCENCNTGTVKSAMLLAGIM